MDNIFSVPPSILSSLMSVGLPPKILAEEGLYLRMSCGMCNSEYLMPTSKFIWWRKKDAQVGLSCSRSCGRKRYFILNPGTSHFLVMSNEFRKGPIGVRRTDEQRKAQSERQKAAGHAPTIRGGNGTGMTAMESLVSQMLTPKWEWNYPVRLGKKQDGYPSCYKLDFGNPTDKVGLEVDGASHQLVARKEQDAKKETKLAELGWKVFRISNKEVQRLCTTSKLKEHLTTLLGTAF